MATESTAVSAARSAPQATDERPMSVLESWNIGSPDGSGSTYVSSSPVHTGGSTPTVHSFDALPDPTAMFKESGHSFTRNQSEGLVIVNASIVAVRSKISY